MKIQCIIFCSAHNIIFIRTTVIINYSLFIKMRQQFQISIVYPEQLVLSVAEGESKGGHRDQIPNPISLLSDIILIEAQKASCHMQSISTGSMHRLRDGLAWGCFFSIFYA